MEIAGYKLEYPLSTGNPSQLWKARDSQGRAVCLRVLPGMTLADRQNLHEKITLLNSLPGCQYGQPYSVERDDIREIVVVSPYFPAISLATLLGSTQALPGPQLRWLGGQLTAALETLHANGYAHQDISPANILLSKKGDVILVDALGIGERTGTPDFAAPEVLRLISGDGDWRPADIYSLGQVLINAGWEGPGLEDLIRLDPAQRITAAQALSLWGETAKQLAIIPPNLVDLAAGRIRANALALTEFPPELARSEKSNSSRRKRHLSVRPADFRRRAVFGLAGIAIALSGTAVGIAIFNDSAAAVTSALSAHKPGAHADVGTSKQVNNPLIPAANMAGLVELNAAMARRIDQLLAKRSEALTTRNESLLGEVYTPECTAFAQDLDLLAQLDQEDRQVAEIITKVQSIDSVKGSPTEWVVSGRWRQEKLVLVQAAGDKAEAGPQPIRAVTVRLEAGSGRITAIQQY